MEKIYLIIFHQQSQIWTEMDFSELRRTHEICGGSSPEVSGLNISSNIFVFFFICCIATWFQKTIIKMIIKLITYYVRELKRMFSQ